MMMSDSIMIKSNCLILVVSRKNLDFLIQNENIHSMILRIRVCKKLLRRQWKDNRPNRALIYVLERPLHLLLLLRGSSGK